MTTKNVLLLGRTGVDVAEMDRQLRMPQLQLFGGTGIDDTRSVLAEAHIDHVIMGAGIDLDVRLEIVRAVFAASDATSVHMKDRVTAKQGMVPFVRSVLRGLDDYAMQPA